MNRTGGLPEGIRYQQVSTQEPQPKLAQLCPLSQPQQGKLGTSSLEAWIGAWDHATGEHIHPHNHLLSSVPYAVAVSTDGEFQCSTAQGYGGQANPWSSQAGSAAAGEGRNVTWLLFSW